MKLIETISIRVTEKMKHEHEKLSPEKKKMVAKEMRDALGKSLYITAYSPDYWGEEEE